MAISGSGGSQARDRDDKRDPWEGGFWNDVGDFFSGDLFPEGSIGARLDGRGPSVGGELREQAGNAWDRMAEWATPEPGTLLPGTNPIHTARMAAGAIRDRFGGRSNYNVNDEDFAAREAVIGGYPNDIHPDPEGSQAPQQPQASDYVGSGPAPVSAPQMPEGPDPFAEIAEAQERAAAQLSSLDDQYQQRLDALRERYEFAETPEEKAQIQFLLGDLEQRKEAGAEAIHTVYEEAINSASERANEMRGRAAETGEQVGETYKQAAEDTAAIFADMDAEQDSAFGVGGEQMSDQAKDWVGLMQAAAPREQSAAQQRGELAAEDVAHLGEAMGEQEAARTAALERLAMMMETQAQAQHDQQVQDRVNQERMQFAQGSQRLQSQFDQRRFGLQDQITDLDAQTAGMAQDARMQNARMQQDAAMANQRAQSQHAQRQQDAAMHDAQMQYEQDMMAWMRSQREQVVAEIMQTQEVPQAEAVRIAVSQYPDLFGG